jgi:hypothetical protein
LIAAGPRGMLHAGPVGYEGGRVERMTVWQLATNVVDQSVWGEKSKGQAR